MKPQLPTNSHWKFISRWLYTNAIGLFIAAAASGVVSGTLISAIAAVNMGNLSYLIGSPITGIITGLAFVTLLGAPAILLALAGGAFFDGAGITGLIIGQSVFGSIALFVMGVVIGASQSRILWGRIRLGIEWIVPSAVGWAIAGTITGVTARSFILDRTFEALIAGQVAVNAQEPAAHGFVLAGLIIGGVGGSISGILQWLYLRRYFHNAGWWVLASTLGWIICCAIAAEVRTGAGLVLGGLAAAAITAIPLAWILRHEKIEA